MEHSLKIKKEYLNNLLDGTKKAEIRLNDRDYQTGDLLKFYNYGTGKYVYFLITHIHSGLGMDGIYVCLSVEMVQQGK